MTLTQQTGEQRRVNRILWWLWVVGILVTAGAGVCHAVDLAWFFVGWMWASLIARWVVIFGGESR